MSAPAAFPFANHRTLAVALAESFRAKRKKLLWWTRERRSDRLFAGDTRLAHTVTVDGVEWWIEPSGHTYTKHWTIYRNGTEVATTRQVQVAKQTVARAVGAKIGG